MQSTSPALFLALWIVDDHAMRSAKPPQLLRFLLEHDHAQARIALEKVEGDGAADDAGADDDDVGGLGHAGGGDQAGRGARPWRTASCTMRTRVVMSKTGRPVAAWISARYGGMFVHSSTIAPISGCASTIRRATVTFS